MVDVAATLRELAAPGFAVDGTVARDPDGNAVELTDERRKGLAAVLAALRRSAGPDAQPTDDPIVVYDTMREAANRIGALLISRGELAAMREMQDEVEAVPVDDVAAQLAMTAELVRRRVAEQD